MKPDAFASLAGSGLADDWFIEVDLATEHLPTVRRKAETYASFYERGQLGPNEIMPKILFAVPNEDRKAALLAMLDRLHISARGLFHTTTLTAAVPYMVQVLRE